MVLDLHKKHELTMSTHQACILLHYNAAPSIPVAELIEKLHISAEDLAKATEPLCSGKHKVLLKETTETGAGVLRWNTQWKPEKVRLTFPASSSRMTQKESTQAKKVVEVDRSFQVDAAVVRIMKMRRRLGHGELVSETSAQLLPHFKPEPKLIKKRIEHLIERCALVPARALFHSIDTCIDSFLI
eukprot:SAG31_NODE_16780_length_696_cov_1.190955_1_plen_186_part_00